MAYSAQTATVICIDVGGGVPGDGDSDSNQRASVRHAGAKRQKQSQPSVDNTVLDKFKNCLALMLQEQLFNEVKDEFAIVVFGKNVSEDGAPGDAQDHIEHVLTNSDVASSTRVVRGFERIGWPTVESADADVVDVGSGKSNFLVGLERCIGLISHDRQRVKGDKRRKISKYNIVCFTSAQQDVLARNVQPVLEKLIDMRIDTKFVIPDETTTDIKQLEQNLGIIRQIIRPLYEQRINDLDSYLTLLEAEDILKAFTPKMSRQLPWKANFEIGEEFEIPVDVFAVTKEATIKQKFTNYMPGQTQTSSRSAGAGDMEDGEGQESGVEVHAVTQYYDKTQKRNIPLDETDDSELARGVKVGRSHIPITDDDRYADLEYQNQRKCFQLLQFAPRGSIIPLYLFDSKFGSRIVMSRKDDEQAAVHLQALTTALQRTDSVVIASYGYNARSTAAIVCLIPETYDQAPQHVALMMHLLPYRQDARQALLDSLRTKASARLETEEKVENISETMEQYVKLLSLDYVAAPKYFNIGLISQASGAGDDREHELEERLTRLVHHANPQMQKLLKMAGYRALHKNEPFPAWTNEEISTIFALPRDLQANEQKAARLVDKGLDDLSEAERLSIKPAVVSAAAADAAADTANDGDTDDKAAQPAANNKKKARWSDIYVSEANDFKVLLEEYELSEPQTKKALDYMCSLCEELAMQTEKNAGHNTPKLTAAMHLFRRKAVKHDFYAEFNAFLERFKTQIQLYKLDGVAKEMQKMDMCLITSVECAGSKVDEKHAKVF